MLFSKDHLPPHLHAQYAEYKALIELGNFELLQGNLPNKALRKAVEYAQANQKDLLEITIPISLFFKGRTSLHPFELDSVVLYEKSRNFKDYQLVGKPIANF